MSLTPDDPNLHQALRAADADFEAKMLRYELERRYLNEWKIESLRGTLELARRSINAIMLMNGGAAVAVLAYAGRDTAVGLRAPLLCFAVGVLLAGITSVLSYQTQLEYTNAADEERPPDTTPHKFAWACAFLGLFAFFAGTVEAYKAMATPSADDRRNAPPPKRQPPELPAYPKPAPTPAPSK